MSEFETIMLPNGASALLAGSRDANAKRGAAARWPEISARDYATASGARLERLLALDDLLQWRELGAEVLVLANLGALFGDAAALHSGEPNALVEITGAAASADGVLLGCFVSAADDEAARFVDAAALKNAWLELGGWAIVKET